jgi:hypothetical protein
MDSADFVEELRPFLLQTTDHFVHELLSFAKAPLDLAAYDECVVYPWPDESSRTVTAVDIDNTNEEREGMIQKPVCHIMFTPSLLKGWYKSINIQENSFHL